MMERASLTYFLIISSFQTTFGDFLFDLQADPLETNNLLNNPNYALKKQDLLNRFEYFKSLPVVHDEEVEIDFSVFKLAGGVVPWLDWSNPSPKPQIPIDSRYIPDYYQQPNIVLMMLDDVGWADGGVNEPITSWIDFTTPNMVTLIENGGIKLANHYTAWVCGPSRASLLTGKYPFRIGYGNMPEANMNLPLNEVTMADQLKKVGYKTALIGKWHMGHQRFIHIYCS
jgi:hypothetical protein